MKKNKKKALLILSIILVLSIIGLILYNTLRNSQYLTDLTEEEKNYIKENKTINFTGQINYAPFEFIDKDGNYNGMMIDLLRWISYEYGFKINFNPTSFKEAQDMVLSGKADGISSLFYSEKREKIFDFSVPVFQVPASIFVYYKRVDISNFKDLEGKRIGMQRGDYAEEFLKENKINAQIIFVDDFYKAIDKIISNEVDAVIGDEQVVWYHIFSMNYIDRIKVIGEPLYIGLNCFGIHKGNKILVNILNKGIQKAIDQGILDRLTKKWIGKSYQVPEVKGLPNKFLIFLMISIASIIVVLVIILLKTIGETRFIKETSEQRLRKIIDSIPFIIYLSDNNQNIIEYNIEFAKFFGISDYVKSLNFQNIGNNIPSLMKKQFEQLSYDDFDALKKSDLIKRESEIIDIYGEKRIFEITKIPIELKNYNKKSILSLAKDVTEEKKAEEEMLRVQKLESVGLLAGKIAHDFNNILTGIIGNLSLAINSIDDKEELTELLHSAKEVSLQAKNITSQLLAFSKGGTPVKELLDPIEVIDSVLKFTVKGSSIDYDFIVNREDRYYIYADKNQFFQAINNIVLNAIQVSEESSKINVKLEFKELNSFHGEMIEPRNYCLISIEDWGSGIEEDSMNKVFNPFFSTKPNGSGLGLSSVKTICKNHNGYVFFENKKDKGVIFYLLFPSTLEKILDKETITENIKTYKEYSIIILDDDEIVINTAKKVFQFFNFKVQSTKSSIELINLLKNKKFDICILDLIIPGSESGDVLVKLLKPKFPDMIYVVSSGYSGNPILSNYKEYGFDYILKKPYDFEDIKNLLKQIEKNSN